MPAIHTDEQLLRALTRGETWAMTAIYDRYGHLVFRLALKILNNRNAAEEAAQEVFVKVWHRARDYDAARGKFSAWLTGITRHHAIDELRRNRVRPTTLEDEIALTETVANDPAPIEVAMQSQERRRIIDALQAIPLEQRRCIEMAYFEGFTQQEISDRLRTPLGTVKTRIRVGMQRLKALLEYRE